MTDWRGTGELAWYEKPLSSAPKLLVERRSNYHCGSCGLVVSKLQYAKRSKCVECWRVDKRIIDNSTITPADRMAVMNEGILTGKAKRRAEAALHNTDVSIQLGRYIGRWPN